MPLMRLHYTLLPRWLAFQNASFIKTTAPCRNHALQRRTFISIPDLSSFSPFPNNNSDGHEQTYHERKILPFTQKQLYDLVADVDNYYRFVPYCTESKVLTSKLANPQLPGIEGKAEKKEARLTVGFLAFKESYVSEVTCKPYLSVEAVASSGTHLFKKLVTTWRFQPASPSSPHPTQSGIISQASPSAPSTSPDNGPTLMSIDLAFAFSNPLYAATSAAFFSQVSAMTIRAFEERCVQVYGQGRQ